MDLLGLLVLGIAACVLIYAEARKEREQVTQVEVEEYDDPWASLPPKWHPTTERYAGPKGRTRLP